MSAEAELVLEKVSSLSVSELLAVQEKIIRELRNKAVEKEPPPVVPLELSVHVLTNWPPDATFRREDIYDDDGR